MGKEERQEEYAVMVADLQRRLNKANSEIMDLKAELTKVKTERGKTSKSKILHCKGLKAIIISEKGRLSALIKTGRGLEIKELRVAENGISIPLI